MRLYLTEFIGTFFLVFTIGLTVIEGTAFAPLAIGASLMVMVYMGGHISGAHYNPAVSLAVLMRGKMALKDLGPYVTAQIVGAFAASAATYVVRKQSFAPAPSENTHMFEALLVEFLFTFALALVVLNCVTAKGTSGNSFYGLAIGFTIAAAAFAGGPISGGAFNPAVGIGPILLNSIVAGGSVAALWIYLLGPLAGGALAAVVFKIQNPEDLAR